VVLRGDRERNTRPEALAGVFLLQGEAGLIGPWRVVGAYLTVYFFPSMQATYPFLKALIWSLTAACCCCVA
jgi:hypothetical protein